MSKPESFAFTTGRMYHNYVERLGKKCPQADYYLKLFPDKKDDPGKYAKYSAEFEAGKVAEKKFRESIKKQ